MVVYFNNTVLHLERMSYALHIIQGECISFSESMYIFHGEQALCLFYVRLSFVKKVTVSVFDIKNKIKYMFCITAIKSVYVLHIQTLIPFHNRLMETFSQVN